MTTPLFHTSLRHLAASAFFVSALVPSFAPGAHAECRGDEGGSSLVAEIRGGDTLILQDGRSVRLAGVLIPKRGIEADIASKARSAAEKQIAELVLGQNVALQLDARQRDRYGRLLAQVFIIQGDRRIWVQERLLALGQARVISFKDNRRCVPELLAAEKAARDAGQGHWATGLFSVKRATSEDVLAQLTQSYEIVEGQVENVTEVKGRIYLNFGQNWRRDFTVTIASDALKLFPGDSGDVAKLKGKPIRVRGWIENVNGPSIILTHPEQLEILPGSAVSQR